MEDERRRQEEIKRRRVASTTENPGHRVMSSLMAGGGASISKPSDAPNATTTMSEGMSRAANAISVPSMHYDDKPLISPVSAGSMGSLGPPAQTATASPTIVASPSAMTSAEPEARDSNQRQGQQGNLQPQPNEHASNRALTFPGNVLAQTDPSRGPARGMSLPMPGQQLAPRSPSQKKHKCPYCETEFTRHHNLKSHLLTHSQEKPYVCQTCSMRFRRLHDLKRHMKLHTGERPHICPKCDRKFARGDALARHSKGQGGCAGRRASTGSFGGDDDYDGSNAGDGEETMDGVSYGNGNPTGSEVGEEDPRRLSLPSIKAPHVQGGQGGSDSYAPSRVPSSYPPIGHRSNQPSGGGLYPPGRARAGSNSSGNSPRVQNSMITSHSPNTSITSMPAGGPSMFSQTGMTESPKPLSPSAMQTHQLGHDAGSINRQRSPSLTTQFQQQQYGRHQSGRGSPVSLPSPHTTSQGPKLPGLSNLAPPDARYTLQTQAPQNPPNGSQHVHMVQQVSNVTSPNTMFQPPMGGRAPPGVPSHQGVINSNDSNNLFAKENGLLSYVQQLEDKNKQLVEQVQYMENRERRQEEHIGRLSEEVYALRSQLAHQHGPQHHPQGSGIS